MAKRTTHTALVNVTSLGSGGRAEIIVGHGSLKKGYSDPFLTSAKFKSFLVGDLVVCRIKLSGTRRLIQAVWKDEDIKNWRDFKEAYKEVLAKEEHAYRLVHGLKIFKPETEEIKEQPEPEQEQPEQEQPEQEQVEEEKVWDGRIYIDPEDLALFNAMKNIAKTHHVATMMIGPSGYGKTSIPQQLAEDWEMAFLRWDCATVRDPEEFFGFRGAKDGSTMEEDGKPIFTKSLFTEVLEKGNAIIVLDELNRIDPYISNILFPLLDHAGRTELVGYEIEVGPNVIFVATVNMGFQFTGTFTLDTALSNRFTAKVLVGPLPKDIEVSMLVGRTGLDKANAEKIVSLMTELRTMNENGSLSIDASTRVSIQLAELIKAGLSIKNAFVYSIINGVSKDEAKVIADKIGITL